jgi:hypothetical protein
MQKKNLIGILIVIVIIIFLVSWSFLDSGGRTSPITEPPQCIASEDCIPLPSECHPHSCMNKEFAEDYVIPEFCTEMFDYGAAYEPEDCGCIESKCVNLNEGRTPEDF